MDVPVSIPIRIADNAAPVRSVGWVLRTAAAMAAIVVSAVILLEFSYRLSAEQSFYRAAKAGMRESALPRANRASIERVIRARLDTQLSRGTRIVLQRSGTTPDTPISVLLSAPADAALPDWLDLVTVWNSGSEITVRIGG